MPMTTYEDYIRKITKNERIAYTDSGSGNQYYQYIMQSPKMQKVEQEMANVPVPPKAPTPASPYLGSPILGKSASSIGRVTGTDPTAGISMTSATPQVPQTPPQVQAPAVPQVPQVSQTPQAPAGETAAPSSPAYTYADYLMSPMSAEDWRQATGVNPELNYERAIRQAETDYMRAKATYGQKAETLGRSGLSSSGYGDYLTGVGYAASQGAKVAASEQLAAENVAAANSYAEYLTGVGSANAAVMAQEEARKAQEAAQTRQIKDTVLGLSSAGWSREDIETYISDYFGADAETTAGYIGSMYDLGLKQRQQVDIGAGMSQEQVEINRAALDYAFAGLEGNQIKQMLISAGASEEMAATAVAEVQKNMLPTLGNKITAAEYVDDIPSSEEIRQLVGMGTLTAEYGERVIHAAQSRRAELLLAEFNDKTADENAEDFFGAVDELYEQGELSKSGYHNLYMARADAGFESAKLDKNPLSRFLYVASNAAKQTDKLGTAFYDEVVNKIYHSLTVVGVKGGVLPSSLEIEIGGVKQSVPIGQSKRANIDPKGSHGTLSAVGGKTYINYKGKMFEVVVVAQTAGSRENLDILNALLYRKAKLK